MEPFTPEEIALRLKFVSLGNSESSDPSADDHFTRFVNWLAA